MIYDFFVVVGRVILFDFRSPLSNYETEKSHCFGKLQAKHK